MAKPKKEGFFTQRDILWYVVFVGCAITSMIRVNINVAIVAMTQSKSTASINLDSECLPQYLINGTESTITTSESLRKTYLIDDTQSTVTTNESLRKMYLMNEKETAQFSTINKTSSAFQNKSKERSTETESDTFTWNSNQRSRILGAYHWLHWISPLPGGMLSRKYGTKLMFGLSNLIAMMMCLLIPMACYLGEYYVIALRIAQGFFTGVCWPSLHSLAAQWIPPNERSKFVTAYLGTAFGTALTFPICGYIIHYLGWKWVFYISGIAGSLWYLAWNFLVYDSPNQNPRISETEKLYILNSLGDTVSEKKRPIPWKKISTSPYFLLNILAQWSTGWGISVFITFGPTYFNRIHGWNIKAIGILSGIPHLVRLVWAYLFSTAGDYLLGSNKVSRTNVRKMAAFSCTILQGLFVVSLAYSGCNRIAAAILFALTVASTGAVSTGPIASYIDLAPNYAGVLLGMSKTIVSMASFMTPSVVAYFTSESQSTVQWQKVFWVSAVQQFIAGFMYICFSKSELQPWNSPEEVPKSVREDELEPLKSDEERRENDR